MTADQLELFRLDALAPVGTPWERAQLGIVSNLDEVRARFLSFVQINGPDDCWPWLGADRVNGYGAFQWLGLQRVASRVAFILFKGAPGALQVLHSCDNPPCCNPAHLFKGTGSANALDAVAKGRWNPYGSRTLLSVDAIHLIRVFGFENRPMKIVLARHFGMSETAIYSIVSRRSYRRIPLLIGPPSAPKRLRRLIQQEQQSSRAASEHVSSSATFPLFAPRTTLSQPMQTPS